MSDFSFTIPDDISGLVIAEEQGTASTNAVTTTSTPSAEHANHGIEQRLSIEDWVLATSGSLRKKHPIDNVEMVPPPYSHLVGSTYAWADEWSFLQQEGYCCFSATAFILNQFVGSGVYDADLVSAQAYEFNFAVDSAPAADLPQLETLLRFNGVEADVVYSGIVDLVERLRGGWGVLAAITVDGHDRLMVLSQVNTHNGSLIFIDPHSVDQPVYEMDIDESTTLWGGSDFSLLATNSINDILNVEDVTCVNGAMAKVALINLTGRAHIH